MTSLGDTAHCNRLLTKELGSVSNPIHTIHRASTDIYQDDLSFVDSQTGHVRLRIKRDGHLQIVEDMELFVGPSIEGGIKKYSVGLNSEGSAFVIRDEVSGTDLFRVDESGPTLTLSIASVSGLQAALNSKQPKLQVNGQEVASAVLDNFMLALDSDGVGYESSLVTAKALRDWFEVSLQPSLIMVQPGQSGPSFRVSSISGASPSAINVPSCAAVNSFVTGKLQDFQPLITPAMNLGNITATSVRSTTTGLRPIPKWAEPHYHRPCPMVDHKWLQSSHPHQQRRGPRHPFSKWRHSDHQWHCQSNWWHTPRKHPRNSISPRLLDAST